MLPCGGMANLALGAGLSLLLGPHRFAPALQEREPMSIFIKNDDEFYDGTNAKEKLSIAF